MEENKELNTAPQQENNAPQEESIADRVRIISPTKLVMKRFFPLQAVGDRLSAVFVALSVFLHRAFIRRLGGRGSGHVGRAAVYTIIEVELVDPEGNPYSVYTVEVFYPQTNIHAAAMSKSTDPQTGRVRVHVLGTDAEGRDIFVRLMYGGRLSLTLSFFVVLIYTFIGVVLGGLAGYFGKWVDMIIMRIVDILNCIPSLPILLIIGAILDGLKVDKSVQIYYMMGFLTLLSWTGVARLVRGQLLFLREQEYIVAAEALGMGPMRKIFRHLIPNVMPQLIVSMTLGLGSIILYEASLSFLGLGVPIEMASWGQMVQSATKSVDILTYYFNDWGPAGFMIILAVLSFNFVGDGLRDALDPKMKR